MNKVLTKFEACFDKLMEKFDAKLDKHRPTITSRMLDSTKLNVTVMRFLLAQLLPPWACYYTSPNFDPTLQVLMAIETEKAE